MKKQSAKRPATARQTGQNQNDLAVTAQSSEKKKAIKPNVTSAAQLQVYMKPEYLDFTKLL